jgi:hypothetical protein
MATAAHPAGGAPVPGVVPPGVVAPPLPFPRDPGTISGWLLDRSLSATSSSIVQDVELGFARLTQGIPDTGDPDYLEAINSADLCCYLTISDTGAAMARVTLIHLLGKYSAGFGARSAFQGSIMGFLGETVVDNLPLFVSAPSEGADRNLSSSFALEVKAVPTDDEVMAYFTSVAAGNLMAPIALTAGNSTCLARLCPIPLAWAAYFLDSKSPFEAWQMGQSLIATLDTPDDRDRVSPLASWLQAACVKQGLAATDRQVSCLDTSWAALAPDA